MRCDDMQEHLVELLYEEGTQSANAEVQAHLRACTACRQELEEMRQTREHLRGWKDESPLRSVSIAGSRPLSFRRKSAWTYMRYGAIAAMALVCILAAANTEISLNKAGVTFSTHLFSQETKDREYYTKSEVRELVKRALDDSESRMNEANMIMAQRTLEAAEQERWMDLNLIRSRSMRSQNSN